MRGFGLKNYGGPGYCATCEHPRRANIDSALKTENESLRYLSERYGISKSALWQHRVKHLGLPRAKKGRTVKHPERAWMFAPI